MRYAGMDEHVARATGLYVAYPTSQELKSIYRAKNYKTKVNHQHTKLGRARNGFAARRIGYQRNFDGQVRFVPVAEIEIAGLNAAEEIAKEALSKKFHKVGRAREWFDTSDRQLFVETVLVALEEAGVEYRQILSVELEWG